MNRGENVRKIDANSYIFILGLQNDGQGSNTYQHRRKNWSRSITASRGLALTSHQTILHKFALFRATSRRIIKEAQIVLLLH
jgi:hypothetical protein